MSAIGAAVALLALTGLALDRFFGWWWADRVAALIVAGIAAVEAVRLRRFNKDNERRRSRLTGL